MLPDYIFEFADLQVRQLKLFIRLQNYNFAVRKYNLLCLYQKKEYH
jgi:hypothetical protein